MSDQTDVTAPASEPGQVNLIGGPFDGQTAWLSALPSNIGYPKKYFLPLPSGETAVYAPLSPSGLGYTHTMSDE